MMMMLLPRSVRRCKTSSKPADVFKVQAGGRLIQQVQGASGLPFAQLAGQLDALRLAAAQGHGRLTEVNVSQPHIDQRLQLLARLGNVLQHGEGFANGRIEQVSDGVSLVVYGQGLAVVALAAADLAEHVDVGQKIHLNPALAFALAGLTAPAGDVEGEAPHLVAALTRLRQHGIQTRESG